MVAGIALTSVTVWADGKPETVQVGSGVVVAGKRQSDRRHGEDQELLKTQCLKFQGSEEL